ncbi:MAG: hypothetical protein R8K20_05125 [Gallionellaceae bacterium]
MKKLFILAVLITVAISIFFLLNNPLWRLVKLAIEDMGPAITQTHVHVSKVNISASDGQCVISGMQLGNPAGFKTEYALKAAKVEMNIDPASISEDVVRIHYILIDAPKIFYENGEQGSNFDVIQHNVERYGEANRSRDQSAGKKMIVDSLIISNAQVSYKGILNLNLPEVELHGIGKKSAGATPAQLIKAIISELTVQIVLAIPKAAVHKVGKAIKGLLGH